MPRPGLLPGQAPRLALEVRRVGEHPIPAGPLAVRWVAEEVGAIRAGALHTFRVGFENVGGAPWRDLKLSYHWLDDRGNPILWDGLRTEIGVVEPGAQVEARARVRGPIPPGRYRLAFDLVLEWRYWLGEVGNTPLTLAVQVAPRIERALGAVGAEVQGQEEPLVAVEEAQAIAHLAPGVQPAPDWSRRVLDAHQEGYALVGGSIDAGRARRLGPWAPGTGRNPSFAQPLLCPSVVAGVEPAWVEPIEGLPAAEAPAEEPGIFDGRIAQQLRR